MKTKKGFTLIETFVAITVLLISLAGPLTLAAQALKSAYYARDEITAFYLAQEGLEYVRAVRDQNYLATPPQSWLTCLNGVSGSNCSNPPNCVGGVCQVDFPHFSLATCPSGVCPAVLVDSNGLFNMQSGTPSGFTRSLTLTPVPGTPSEVTVSVTVSWVSAGINRSFTLSEDLFNWLGT